VAQSLALKPPAAVTSAQAVTVPSSAARQTSVISLAAAGASWLHKLSAIPRLEKLAWTQVLPEFDPFKYNSFAINAGDQVHRLTRRLVRDIELASAADALAGFSPTSIFLSTVDATVTAEAVIDNLLKHLEGDGNELVLFDINRSKVKSTLLVKDPGPLTRALAADVTLSFDLTIIGNENPKSDRVVARRTNRRSSSFSITPIDERWPPGTISLSHVALPFPADDPLYGARNLESNETLHLGDLSFRGERGLLLFPADWLLRTRYNPFYDYLELRTIDWITQH
jgi:hypothetical protein